MRGGVFCGGGDVVVARTRAPAGDVGANGVVEQERILADERDRRAQRSDGDGADFLVVELDAAAVSIVEAEKQIEHSALARSRRADERDLLAGGNVERHAGKRGGVLDDRRR